MIKSREDIPEKPGVYLFKSRKKTLYIGKAKNLRKRIAQYLQHRGHGLIGTLLDQADDVEFIVTDDEKDALHLEYNLIQDEQPPFNIRLKDDKTFPYIELTSSGKFPGIYYTRQPDRKSFCIGPITNAQKTRDIIDVTTRVFKLRTCSDAVFKRASACLYYYIERCSAPCIGKIGEEAYAQNLAAAKEFLKGKKDKILKMLEKRMTQCAGELKFEQAQQVKEDIELIRQFALESYISTARRVDWDVLTLYHDARGDCFIILFSVLEGRVRRREFFNFDTVRSKKEEILKDFLLSFYKQENIPREIVVPFDPADRKHIEALFSRLVGKKVTIKVPVRGDRRKTLDLAKKNLNLYVSRHRYDALGQRLKEALHLARFPEEIEGFDVSHLSERERVGAVVTFCKGKPVKKNYRNYLIKEAAAGDVFALKEILERRFKKGQSHPDLLMIDGGKSQLNAARQVKERLAFDADIVAIAKGEERIYLEAGGSVVFPQGSPERFLLQNIRDEAHRRAISHHRKRREKI